MKSTPGLAQKDDFVKIAAAHQPRTREDGSYRLAYLTATISMLSADCISDCLSQCRQGKFGEPIRAMAAEPIPYDSYSDAIKHLTCIIFYLISFEQGSDSPEWLADFLASCVKAMDQVVQQGRPAQEIMGRYALVSGERVYATVAKFLMNDLGFKNFSDIAGQPLCHYLENSVGFRSQILYFALSQDREFIERRWREIIAQNTLVTD